jgi:three-Cys-motif partner protein
MVDQQAAEIRWSTLEQLSKFKVPNKPKVELWLLFAPSMLPRGLASVDPEAVERFADRITAMYGSEDWRDAYVASRRGLLSGGELLNLMRWRMEKLLGYRVTHPFEMKNTRGTPLFNMIFATDHPAGERIMNHIYGTAAQERPRMQAEAAANVQEAKEEKLGTPGLFAPMPKTIKPDNLYAHQPPTRPYRLPTDV